MRAIALLLLTGFAALAEPGYQNGWRLAEPGYVYQFPRDHGAHPDFKTEWWYFTGQLRGADGREYGYETTWFRQGVIPHPPANVSRFIKGDFKFAHFAISNIAAGQFHYGQKIARGAYGEAGCGDGTPGPLAWIDDWRLTVLPDGAWHIAAEHDGNALDLTLAPEKPPVIEGKQGISRKSAGEGHASCYYSYTRMRAAGTLTLAGGPPLQVSGETWFDHEWATNQLSKDQAGWDWFSVQFSGNTELMLYQMRLKDGRADPVSSGAYTRKDGTVVYLDARDFHLTPLEWWKAPRDHGPAPAYPIRWRIEVPSLGLACEISTPLKDQELAFPGITYWEGLIHAEGTLGGAPIAGHGYLELTGYDSAIQP
ncbi:MAG TPA: lipocalin-like domain-containing protein [Chthoniobacteraceae bacterium]|nr:lipocalin-like domain-containing protein [Chthoniobacteraceae bacterium]